MKWHWFGMIVGALLYILALIPGFPPHRADIVFMTLSGMLVASVSVLGFDLPYPHKKLGIALLTFGCVLFLGSVLMIIFDHPYILFVTLIPSLALVLFGLRLLAKRNARE